MLKPILVTIFFLFAQLVHSQYSSIDTVYYPNQQIDRIVLKLQGDSTTIIRKYYSQYTSFREGDFLLGEKKQNKIESIETYRKSGDNGLTLEGYSEYFYQNGHKKLEVIYSRKRGNRYINFWEANANQLLISGNGIYTKRDILFVELDSFVYEVRDSMFHGKCTVYRKDKTGKYYSIVVQHFEKNKQIGYTEIYNPDGKMIRREE